MRSLRTEQGRTRILSDKNPPYCLGLREHKVSFRILIFVCWVLSFACYNPHGRSGPTFLAELDWIAVMKVTTRILALVLLGAIFLTMRRTYRKRRVIKRLLPLSIFSVWAIASTAWSPLKAGSLGHGGELLMLVLFAVVTGVLCSDTQKLSTFLLHITMIMLVFTLLSMVLYYVAPSTSGGYHVTRPHGIVHPNLAAQVAGVGLLIVLLCRILWGWTWTRYLVLPMFFAGGLFLLISRSRVALGATTITLGTCLILFRKRSVLSFVVVTLALSFTILVCTGWLDYAVDHVEAYVLRGQSIQEFKTATGRLGLWKNGLAFFLHSPLVGNGYYAFSPTGFIELEGEPTALFGAHNLVLHVLTGLGVIGGLLFVWGLCRPLAPMACALYADNDKRLVAIWVLVLMVWYSLVGLFEVSFLGPINPATVAFFAILGIAAGHL